MYTETGLGLLPIVVGRAAPAVAPVARVFPNLSQLLGPRRLVAVLPAPRLMPALPRYGGTIRLTPANQPVISQAPTNSLAPVSTGMDVPAPATESLGPDAPPAAEPADSTAAPAAASAGAPGINPLWIGAAVLVALWAFKGSRSGGAGIRGW